MPRRKTVNDTGIKRIEGIPIHEAWVAYVCLKCNMLNHERIGKELLKSGQAYEECVWICNYCGFIHSKDAELPFDNWDEEIRDPEMRPTQGFWQGFFRIATEQVESYWKQCNVCGRILPYKAFSKHKGWGPLSRQMECRSCKGAINAVPNPKRTNEQLAESSVRRRIADMFVKEENERIDIEDLFRRFNGQCFMTKVKLDIEDRSSWAIDHILPSKYLYPLTKENSALLSKQANESKGAVWPSKVYTNSELVELARITNGDLELFSSPKPIVNRNIDVDKGIERYLDGVRDASNLHKRIKELQKIIVTYNLVDKISFENKNRLQLTKKE